MMNQLISKNHQIRVIQKIIIGLRAGKLIPGIGITIAAAEKLALKMLNLITAWQDKIIQAQGFLELSGIHCSANKYSKQFAKCLWRPIKKKQFWREKALWPKPRGTIRIHRKYKKMRFTCTSIGTTFRTSIEFSKGLESNNWKYRYE